MIIVDIDQSENNNRVFPLRSGYSYKVAVALSLFLGWLGADRFYLGYPALGTHTHTHTALSHNNIE